MIDSDLIEKNENILGTALNQSRIISPVLRVFNHAFTTDLLNKLTQYFEHNYHSDLWVPETDTYGKPMTHVQRTKLTWEADTVIEESHEVCQAQKSLIEHLLGKSIGGFRGIVIWRDHPGYAMGWHTDNPVIGTSVQIYLHGSSANPGTEFRINDQVIEVPFVPNTGYLVDQSNYTRPTHRVAGTVPDNHVRYSLFAMWNNIL